MSESAVYIGIGRPSESPVPKRGLKDAVRRAFTFSGAEKGYREKHDKEIQELITIQDSLPEEERKAAAAKLEQDINQKAHNAVYRNYASAILVTATVTFGGFLIGNEKFRRNIGKTKFIGKPLEKFGDTGSDFLHSVVRKIQDKLHPHPLGNPDSPPLVKGEYPDFSLSFMERGRSHDSLGRQDPYVDRPYNNFERTVPVDTEEMKFGILNLGKWSEATRGKETSGILFVDANNKTRFRDYMTGDEYAVKPKIFDGGKSPLHAFVRDSIARIKNHFVLLSPNYPAESEAWPLPKENIIERGKQIIGSIHFHPDDSPPSHVDFVQLLADKVNHIAGVHTKDKTFFMVRSKETPLLSEKDTASLVKEMERKMIQGGLTNETAMKLLSEYAKKFNVVMYAGHIVQGVLSRII